MLPERDFCSEADRFARSFTSLEVVRDRMSAFTGDDVGKRVVTQSGATVGEVVEVRDGSAWVEPAPDVDPEVESHLRWDRIQNREKHELGTEFVSTVTDDAVRLRV